MRRLSRIFTRSRDQGLHTIYVGAFVGTTPRRTILFYDVFSEKRLNKAVFESVRHDEESLDLTLQEGVVSCLPITCPCCRLGMNQDRILFCDMAVFPALEFDHRQLVFF